ncbi:UNVERIFIED_CONTAM: protein NEOXANTHIN-DEFICIENT 1 [Sesamum radiatum]|uniref:Protein NEOXANTHIN-DEFICIENT 1 n=1 Tax=Sesamum radiatum TaxID=300843 RepID=A0AAW2RYF6_SESRA
METADKNSALGYGKPPWLFVDRRSISIKRSVFDFFSALYQLHLVKAETARAFIPKEFKLVEAFGYTLGGFFLANYEDSPAGNFDELVVIAGIVWNPPTSCALRAVPPAKVSSPSASCTIPETTSECGSPETGTTGDSRDDKEISPYL